MLQLLARLGAAETAVARGQLYEQLVQFVLSRKFGDSGLTQIRPVGQTGDRGVDLIADWNKIGVLLQCKCSKARPAGVLWRDLRGIAAQSAPHPTLAVLVTPLPMSAGGHAEFAGSKSPFMHCVIPLRTGELSTVVNNAAKHLLQMHGVDIRILNYGK